MSCHILNKVFFFIFGLLNYTCPEDSSKVHTFWNDALAVSHVNFHIAVPQLFSGALSFFQDWSISSVQHSVSTLSCLQDHFTVSPLQVLLWVHLSPRFRRHHYLLYGTFKMGNLAVREWQWGRGLCGVWAPEKHFAFLRGMGGGCPVPAPKLPAATQARAELPPGVNPAAPVRQFNKSLLMLCLFTRKLFAFFFFFPYWFHFRDGKLLLCHSGGKKSKKEAHDFCCFWNHGFVMLNSCKLFALQCTVNKRCHQLKCKLSKMWGALSTTEFKWFQVRLDRTPRWEHKVLGFGSHINPVVSKSPHPKTPRWS